MPHTLRAVQVAEEEQAELSMLCGFDEGKRHNQALVALARRRRDTLYAMLRDGTLYAPKATAGA